jgi:hypothetical protein
MSQHPHVEGMEGDRDEDGSEEEPDDEGEYFAQQLRQLSDLLHVD